MEGYKSFAITITGAEHTKIDKVCQDASLSCTYKNAEIAIVADGHGSDSYFRSHVGSEIAINVALEVFKRAVDSMSEWDEEKINQKKHDREWQNTFMNRMKDGIACYWSKTVEEDFKSNPFAESELQCAEKKYQNRYTMQGRFNWAYGTTLLGAVVMPNMWFAVQIGDGNIVENYGEGKFVESMPEDPVNGKSEASASLCQSDALAVFRHYINFEKIPQMVILHTDGIDDSLLDDETRNDVYLAIGSSFVKSYDDAVNNISNNIVKHIAENWKRDDTSVAGIVRLEGLTKEAKSLYDIREVSRKRTQYRMALKKKAELEDICRSLNANLNSLIAKKDDLQKEYNALSAKMEAIRNSVIKNKEVFDNNKKALDLRKEELAKCQQLIDSFKNAPDSASNNNTEKVSTEENKAKQPESKPDIEENTQQTVKPKEATTPDASTTPDNGLSSSETVKEVNDETPSLKVPEAVNTLEEKSVSEKSDSEPSKAQSANDEPVLGAEISFGKEPDLDEEISFDDIDPDDDIFSCFRSKSDSETNHHQFYNQVNKGDVPSPIKESKPEPQPELKPEPQPKVKTDTPRELESEDDSKPQTFSQKFAQGLKDFLSR